MNEETKTVLKNVKISLQQITVYSFNYENEKYEHVELSGAYTRKLIAKLVKEIDRALGVSPVEQNKEE